MIILNNRQSDALLAFLREIASAAENEQRELDAEIQRLEKRHAALFAAEKWLEDIEVYAQLVALRARKGK